MTSMLEAETKKMEEKLNLVKKMMELEKDKRSQLTLKNDGSMWRGATTKKKIGGYSDAVIKHHYKNQTELPPTSLVTDTREKPPSKQAARTKASNGFISS